MRRSGLSIAIFMSAWPSPWRELAEAYGGAAALAKACGVSRQTLWRWTRGDRPNSLHTTTFVNRLARRLGVKEPFVSDGT